MPLPYRWGIFKLKVSVGGLDGKIERHRYIDGRALKDTPKFKQFKEAHLCVCTQHMFCEFNTPLYACGGRSKVSY